MCYRMLYISAFRPTWQMLLTVAVTSAATWSLKHVHCSNHFLTKIYLFIYYLHFRVANMISLVISLSRVPFHITTVVVNKIGIYI